MPKSECDIYREFADDVQVLIQKLYLSLDDMKLGAGLFQKVEGIKLELSETRKSESYKFCKQDKYFSTIKNLDEFMFKELQIYKDEAWVLTQLKSLSQWLTLKTNKRYRNYAMFIHRNLKRGGQTVDNRKAIADLTKNISKNF